MLGWKKHKLESRLPGEIITSDMLMTPPLVDRVPEELWTEVCNIVQETVIKTFPQIKKYKKAN